MSRRNKPPNRWGCKPDHDVCVAHDLPLMFKHGCIEAGHIHTANCSYDRQASANEDRYVCQCGWRDSSFAGSK